MLPPNGSGAQRPVRKTGDTVSSMQRTPGRVSSLRPVVPFVHLQDVPRLPCPRDPRRGSRSGRALCSGFLGQVLAPAFSPGATLSPLLRNGTRTSLQDQCEGETEPRAGTGVAQQLPAPERDFSDETRTKAMISRRPQARVSRSGPVSSLMSARPEGQLGRRGRVPGPQGTQ